MTEIYVDVLLVINYVINALLLGCLAKVTGRKPKGSRLVAAAVMGSIGSLTIFLPFPGFFLSLMEKLILSALMVRIAFRYRGWRAFLREWLIFFVVSFFFAGAMIALWLVLRPAGMLYYNGVVYFDIPALLLVALSVTAYLAIGLFWRFSRNGRIRQESYTVRIRLGHRYTETKALVDTGNSLREPFSGTPVIVCHLDDVAPLLDASLCAAIAAGDTAAYARAVPRLRMIAYRVVGGGGMLPAFRPDGVELWGHSRRVAVEDVYIAVSPRPLGREDGSHAILNPDLVEHKV